MTYYHTLFKNAPIIILVYLSFYENDAYNMLKYLREDEYEIIKARRKPLEEVVTYL